MILSSNHFTLLSTGEHYVVEASMEPLPCLHPFMKCSVRVTVKCACGEEIVRRFDHLADVDEYVGCALVGAIIFGHSIANDGNDNSKLLQVAQELRDQFCVPADKDEFTLLSCRERVVECVRAFDAHAKKD